jgi:hypothetical protein
MVGITGVDSYVGAAKQSLSMIKTASRTSLAFVPFSVHDLAGSPGAGVLAGTSTAAGVFPTDATAGYPTIDPFGASALGYLSALDYTWDVIGTLELFDTLFTAGAYAFNAATTLAAQPSFSGRVPGGTYSGLEIWIECVTAFTGIPSFAVQYMNAAGVTAHTTGVISMGTAMIVGEMRRLSLQAGDSGVQKIEAIAATVATAGTFNIHVLRRLATKRIAVANDVKNVGFLDLGGRQVYTDSALRLVATPDSTSTGKPKLYLEVANA